MYYIPLKNSNSFVIQILYAHISEVEKLQLTARGSGVRLRTRTFRNVKFIITRDRESIDVYDTILKLSNPSKYMFFF